MCLSDCSRLKNQIIFSISIRPDGALLAHHMTTWLFFFMVVIISVMPDSSSELFPPQKLSLNLERKKCPYFSLPKKRTVWFLFMDSYTLLKTIKGGRQETVAFLVSHVWVKSLNFFLTREQNLQTRLLYNGNRWLEGKSYHYFTSYGYPQW